MEQKKENYWRLFYTFLKIGAFTFGGGYAMIPLIHKEAVENHKWITDEDVLNIIAIAESTPGVLAVNSATFVGYRVAGFWGSLLATVGVVLPAFLVISILSFFIAAVKENQWVSYAFLGVRAGVIVLMWQAVTKLSKSCSKGLFNIAIMIGAFLLASTASIDVIVILMAAAVIGIVCKSRTPASDGEGGPK